MVRETQLDTHEIDKLLADDDFIDDFDFSEDPLDQFVDAEGNVDGESGDDSDDDFEFELDEPQLDESDFGESPPAKQDSAGTGLVASENKPATVVLEVNNPEVAAGESGKSLSNLLKIVIGCAFVFWLAQVFGVIYLLKQPLTIRDEVRPLVAETDLLEAPNSVSEMGADVTDDSAVVVNPAEPDILLFKIYLPLYSLEGLKVFSAEIEIVQFQESGRLLGEAQKKLQEGLRNLLQKEIGVRLREEIVDAPGHLSSLIAPYIETFFVERGVDLNKVKIRIHNPNVR